MTNHEIGKELARLSREERRITNEILKLINLAQENRSYLELGFSSMFDWLTRGLRYSNGAAYRRIEAARLLKSVPEVSEKLADGRLNLTTLSRAQYAIKTQEKLSGKKLSPEAKSAVVQKIETKSSEEAERILLSLLPESDAPRERKQAVAENLTRYSLNFPTEMVADLKRAKEVLSHVIPQGSDTEVLAYALKFLLKKKDPLQTSAPEAIRVTKTGARRITLHSSNGSCTYQDPLTGQVCGSRHQIETDHIVPKALGGKDTVENFRPLCRQHNVMMAEKAFGKEFMRQYRRKEE